MRHVAGVRPLRRSLDDRRPVLEIPGPLRRRDDQRDRTVGLLAAVQQPQRFGDPPRILVTLNGDRETAPKSLLVAPGRRMYRLAIVAPCAAGVDRPCGYKNVVHTRGIGVLGHPHLHLPEPHSATPVATAMAAC